MDFLKTDIRNFFFRENPGIYTKVEDLPPAKYNSEATLSNSLIASGCIINGSVENSVLFKKVYVGNNCVIKNSIINNLNEAITSYSRNNSNGEYYLPIFEETDWDQIYRNVSMVTFLQGIPIGLKKYNNYSIVTSTNNKEYVNPSEIYLIGSDEYYHIDGCDKALINDISIAGYRNIDYKVQSYTEKEIVNGTEEKKVYNYYKHNNYNGTTKKACYYCIIQKELYNKSNDSNIVDVMHKAYIKALAREKYNNRKTRL